MAVLLGLMKSTGLKQWDLKRPQELTQERYEQLQQDQASLTNFVNGDLGPYVQFSHQNYRQLFDQVTAAAENLSEYMPNRGTFGMALSHSVLTFAATLCMHKEQTDTKIFRIRRDRWGKEFAKSKKPLGSIYYDRFFGYRFFARLRNFLLHESAELITSEISRSMEDQGPKLTVFARRDDLVGTRDRREYWSTVAAEIDQLDDKIDLTPLMAEATEAAVLLTAQARLLLHPGISRRVRRMQSLRSQLGDIAQDEIPTTWSMPDHEIEADAGPEVHPAVGGVGFEIADTVADLIRSSRGAI